MKNTLKKPLSLLFAALLLAVVFSACGVDPNVKQEKKATNDYAVQISGKRKKKNWRDSIPTEPARSILSLSTG